MASVGCFIQRRLVLHRLAAVRRWVESIPRSEKLVAGVMRKERRPMKYRLASQTTPSIYDRGRRLSRGEDSRQFVSDLSLLLSQKKVADAGSTRDAQAVVMLSVLLYDKGLPQVSCSPHREHGSPGVVIARPGLFDIRQRNRMGRDREAARHGRAEQLVDGMDETIEWNAPDAATHQFDRRGPQHRARQRDVRPADGADLNEPDRQAS